MSKKCDHLKSRAAVLSLLVLTAASSLSLSGGDSREAEKLLIRVSSSSAEKMKALAAMPLDFACQAVEHSADIVVSPSEFDGLLAAGYDIEVLARESDARNSDALAAFHTYERTVERLREFENAYPHLCRTEIIGASTLWRLPIWAIKISDHPEIDEDETAVLVDGMHHAREPIGNEICLALIERLLTGYGFDPRVTSWVDDDEIWVIPILNPEGFKYLMDNRLASPWWRKNLRDNNGNGRIDPSYDGVDLNRNYDLNWLYGGSSDPSSWTYRGPEAFSEAETRAKRDLAFRERFAAAVSFHSYGELIYYQWSWPQTDETAPDNAALVQIASDMAGRIRKLDGNGSYTISRQGAYNQSSPWIYATLGTFEFLVEVGTAFIPPASDIGPLVAANLEGLAYVLDRLKGPGISAKIVDALTGAPLEAAVFVSGVDDTRFVRPRRTEPRTGRFVHYLLPGTYTLLLSAAGYRPEIVRIDVGDKLHETVLALRPVAR